MSEAENVAENMRFEAVVERHRTWVETDWRAKAELWVIENDLEEEVSIHKKRLMMRRGADRAV
jgi:hypothetical protein